MHVRGVTHHALHVVPLDHPRRRTVRDGGDIAEQGPAPAVFHDGNIAHVVSRLDAVLRNLHLDLKTVPFTGSRQKFGSVKRLEEVAATMERATPAAVRPYWPARSRSNRNVESRIVERPREPQVSQLRNLRQFPADCLRIDAIRRHVGALDRDLDRRGRSETHNRLTMSPASKVNWQLGRALRSSVRSCSKSSSPRIGAVGFNATFITVS